MDMCRDMGMCVRMDMCTDMCLDMCMDLCTDTCTDMRLDMCITICIDKLTCMDMCADVFIGMRHGHTLAYTQVAGQESEVVDSTTTTIDGTPLRVSDGGDINIILCEVESIVEAHL